MRSSTPKENPAAGNSALGFETTDETHPQGWPAHHPEQFRHIAQSARDAIISIDHRGRVVYWNPAAEAMFQYRASEMEGKPVSRIVPPAYREGHEQAMQRIATKARPKCPAEVFELEGLRRDGTTFPVELSVSNWQMEGSNYFTAFLRDVTERKQAADDLRDSDRYNRMLFERAPIGMALCRMNGDLVDCNSVFTNIVGRTREELMRRNCWALTPEEFAEEERQQLESLESTNRCGPYEKEYVHSDGHRVRVRVHGAVVEKGGERFVWSSVEDISATDAAHRALRESQSLFARFMDYLPAAVFVKDDQSRVVYANRYLKERFVVDDEQGACEHRSTEVGERQIRDDRRALAESQYETVETLKDRTGEERTFRTHKFVISQTEGRRALLGGIAWDITEAVEAAEAVRGSERRYREIFETAQEGIWLIDADAMTLEVNKRMAEMLGYLPDEMQGRHVFEFMDEEARRQSEVLLARRRKGIAEKYDFRFRTKDGRNLWTIVNSVPMRNAEGDYAGALRMVTDITERKRSEDALRNQEERLRLILSSTGEGIFGLDMDGRCTFANRACLELLGYGDVYDLLGKRMHELIHHTRHDGTRYPSEECPTYRSCTLRHVTFADDELLWRADGTSFHAERI